MIGGVADENVIGLPVREKRSFSTDRKLQLVEQASAPGASVSAVAKQNGLAPSQIFMWRKELRTGKLTETKNTEPLSAVEHYYQMLAKIERLQVEGRRSDLESKLVEAGLGLESVGAQALLICANTGSTVPWRLR